jgi:hypothetical protein
MKKLNSKLFGVASVSALILVALICYFIFKDVDIIPNWGLVTLGVVGGIMTVSLLILIIRDKKDNI